MLSSYPFLPWGLFDPLIRAPGDEAAHQLDQLDDDHHEHYAQPGDVTVGALVAVDDGDLTQTGAAQSGGQSGIAEDGHG